MLCTPEVKTSGMNKSADLSRSIRRSHTHAGQVYIVSCFTHNKLQSNGIAWPGGIYGAYTTLTYLPIADVKSNAESCLVEPDPASQRIFSVMYTGSCLVAEDPAETRLRNMIALSQLGTFSMELSFGINSMLRMVGGTTRS